MGVGKCLEEMASLAQVVAMCIEPKFVSSVYYPLLIGWFAPHANAGGCAIRTTLTCTRHPLVRNQGVFTIFAHARIHTLSIHPWRAVSRHAKEKSGGFDWTVGVVLEGIGEPWGGGNNRRSRNEQWDGKKRRRRKKRWGRDNAERCIRIRSEARGGGSSVNPLVIFHFSLRLQSLWGISSGGLSGESVAYGVEGVSGMGVEEVLILWRLCPLRRIAIIIDVWLGVCLLALVKGIQFERRKLEGCIRVAIYLTARLKLRGEIQGGGEWNWEWERIMGL